MVKKLISVLCKRLNGKFRPTYFRSKMNVCMAASGFYWKQIRIMRIINPRMIIILIIQVI